MRLRTLVIATALLGSGLVAPPAHAGNADCFGLFNLYCAAEVRGAPPSWVTVGTERDVNATLYRVQGRMPADEIEGAPVQLRVRAAGGGDWSVMDEGTLTQDSQQRLVYKAPLTYSFPEEADVETQVRTFINDRWFYERKRRHLATTETGSHAPTGLDPSVQSQGLTMNSDLTRAAWWGIFEFAEVYHTSNPYDLERRLPFFPGFDPEWADDVDSLVASRLIYFGEDPVGPRVVLLDRAAGEQTPVAYLENGERARFSSQPSTSNDARWVAYSSTSRRIVSPSAKGRKVFVADTTTDESRLLGLGSRPAVSGNGRFVAYLKPDGTVVRWNRTNGRTRVITAMPPRNLGSLGVTDNGSLVWSQEARNSTRAVVFRATGADRSVVGQGTRPAITDDARWIAFVGGYRYPDGSYGGVRRHDTTTDTTEVVATGPDGGPSITRIGALDLDATGRYVVAAADGGRYPLMPNSSIFRAVRFDLEAD